MLWKIDQIEIYSENLKNEKILNFKKSNEYFFSIIKNFDFYNYLIDSIKRDKLIKFNKKIVNLSLLKKKNYKLIINCNSKNLFSKKFFYKKDEKNYNSYAFTTTISHKKIDNTVATQFFLKKGPLAFLPISKYQTSVVYSARGNNNFDMVSLIKKYNSKYSITKIDKIANFELKSFNLRKYYHKNILAFGDLLHKIHPLAGQGFNMSIRDIEKLLQIIQGKIDNGLDIDVSVCSDFEKKTKHTNYIFSSGIDFIYEFFNLESKINNKLLSKSVKFFGDQKVINKIFVKFADEGIII